MFYKITVASILEAILGGGGGEERCPAASAFLMAFSYCGQKQPEGFPAGPVVKNLPCNARDTGSILGLGRSHMQLSPCGRTTEPHATVTDAVSSPCTSAKNSSCSLQLEKAF